MRARDGRPTLGGLAGRAAVVVVVTMSMAGSAARAQAWPGIREVRPFVGAYLPTGSHHALLEQSPAVGAQLALELGRGAHVVAGFSWVPTEQRGVASGGRVEMAQFDLGAEWLSPGRRRLQRRFNPLIGTGVGLRAYRSRDTDAPSQANVAGYGALGAELALGRLAVRAEGRDYLTAFKGLDGRASTSLRNDVLFALGLGYHLR